jgi:hypothetical protein
MRKRPKSMSHTSSTTNFSIAWVAKLEGIFRKYNADPRVDGKHQTYRIDGLAAGLEEYAKERVALGDVKKINLLCKRSMHGSITHVRYSRIGLH